VPAGKVVCCEESPGGKGDRRALGGKRARGKMRDRVSTPVRGKQSGKGDR